MKRFFKHLLSTDKRLSPQQLLDIAYLTVSLPLITVVKLPVLLYLLLFAVLLIRDKKISNTALSGVAIFGISMIIISLFGELNFAGLSRLKIFVEAILYLLILAVTLQRLTYKINFYQIISPMLILAISLFFFDSIAMLLYVIFEIFILLWLILAFTMRAGAKESLKMAVRMYLLSLPWVILLFIFFPRISFEHASYGFRDDGVFRAGHDGTMYTDDRAMKTLSKRVVMEVAFKDKIPPSSKLYFRGSVLYEKKGNLWTPLPVYLKRAFAPKQSAYKESYEYAKERVEYSVVLYPTHKKWIYMLDLPIKAPTGGYIDADFSITYKGGVRDKLNYSAVSALDYRYGRVIRRLTLNYALQAERKWAPKTYEAAKEIVKEYPNPKERLEAIIKFFKSQKLVYSTSPKGLDKKSITDSFLFKGRQGYCVHFADAFTLMSRYAGIPARIVTGYKGFIQNSVKNYIIIREMDAHAWCEVYIDRCWRRIDPTIFAYSTVAGISGTDNSNSDIQSEGSDKTTLYYLYIKYRIESWILHYSHYRQMTLLKRFKNDTKFAITFVLTLIAVAVSIIGLYLYFTKTPCRKRGVCEIRALLKRLAKRGFVKAEDETISALLKRYGESLDDDTQIVHIEELYRRCRYAEDDEACKELKQKVRSIE